MNRITSVIPRKAIVEHYLPTAKRQKKNSAAGSEAIRNLGFSLAESENLEACIVCERLKRGCGQV